MSNPIVPITPSSSIFSVSPGSVAVDAGTIYGKIMLALGIIAGGVAMFYLIWGGIKYMQAGGDTKKAETARSMIVSAVIGAALIIGALTIFYLAQDLGNIISNAGNGGNAITFPTGDTGSSTSSTSGQSTVLGQSSTSGDSSTQSFLSTNQSVIE